MFKKVGIAAAAAVAFVSPAHAAADLTSAMVTGPTGTVWNTTVDGFFALFLQQPIGTLLNPNDNFTSDPTASGNNSFSIFGEGFRPGETVNSDETYTLTLMFADGATITGAYSFGPLTPGGQFLGGTTAVANGTAYTLTGFGWDRSQADNVSAFQAVSGGDPFDYTGQFAFNTAAVPEPSTWAMFILGFGALGFAMRRQNAKVTSAKATLRFA